MSKVYASQWLGGPCPNIGTDRGKIGAWPATDEAACLLQSSRRPSTSPKHPVNLGAPRVVLGGIRGPGAEGALASTLPRGRGDAVAPCKIYGPQTAPGQDGGRDEEKWWERAVQESTECSWTQDECTIDHRQCCGGARTLLRALPSTAVRRWGEWEVCLGLPEQGDCAVAVRQPPTDQRR
ncbi:hypothetical protein NDU88_003712 [Pleurodeles waltl]|uniref:Uncharacterized protein n=1 Tax=Pleurodeles waltl TaxID=8319 RepID=A0AAV7MRD3_PLEWA|nr:hypothetical protein NDU88_003712 [Pleurodeles waltl]